MPTPSQQIVAQLAAQYGSFDPTRQQLLRKTYYDYVRYSPAGVSSLTLFTVPLGGTDPVSLLTKTAEQTNLSRSAQFENVSFIIYQIRTHIFLLPKNRQPSAISSQVYLVNGGWAAVQAALVDLADQGEFLMKIGQKDYFTVDCPFRRMPPGFGVEIGGIPSATAASGTPVNFWMQQSARQQDIYTLTPPQMIENQQTFTVNVAFPRASSPAIPQVNSANSAVDIGVLFDGYVIEPVQ